MLLRYCDSNIFGLNRQANAKIYIFDAVPKKTYIGCVSFELVKDLEGLFQKCLLDLFQKLYDN